jgi:hypothetical protein
MGQRWATSVGNSVEQWWACRYPPFHEVLPVQDGCVFAECAPASPHAWLEQNWQRVVVDHATMVQRSLPASAVDWAPNIAGVYFLIQAGEVVYVGKSKEIACRLAAHQRSGRQFDRFWLMYGLADGMLDAVESLYIDAIRPVGNSHLMQRWPILERAFRKLRG